MKHNDEKHWEECKHCQLIQNEENHKAVNISDKVEPTCILEGSTTGKKCSVCDYVIEEIKPIDALGHTYDHDCDAECNRCKEEREIEHIYEAKHDKNKHWEECSVCHNIINEEEHNWDEGVITKEPSKKEEGTIEHKCECGETKVEVLPKVTGCKNGSIQSIFYLLSMFGVVFVLRKRKMF